MAAESKYDKGLPHMPSIHDSLLTGYTVHGTNRKIVLRTESHRGGGTALIDVIFGGVVTYHFEGDCLGNIVFDIDEVPTASIIGHIRGAGPLVRIGQKVGNPTRRDQTNSFHAWAAVCTRFIAHTECTGGSLRKKCTKLFASNGLNGRHRLRKSGPRLADF